LLVDYGVLKRALRALCDEWDEVLLLPGRSKHLRVDRVEGQADKVRLRFGCGDAAAATTAGGEDEMVLPASDVLVLPVANITGEELSSLLLQRFLERCGTDLQAAGVHTVSVGVSSGPGQRVTSTWSLPTPPRTQEAQQQQQQHQQQHQLQHSHYSTTTTRTMSTLAPSRERSMSTVATVGSPPQPTSLAPGVAVVTGASSGIGRAVAQHLVQRGWAVHNISRRPLDEPWAHNHVADAAQPEALRAAATTVAKSIGGPTRVAVVHCAGVHTSDSLGSIAASSDGVSHMLHTFNVNVVAPALVSSVLLPCMAPGSSVVYVGSTLSEIGVAGRLSYVASKHAVVGLLRATVQDLFGKGVHAACVCPGFTDTPMLDDALEQQMGLRGDELQRVRRAIEGMASFGRLVRPDEVAALVGFVVDNPALNGAVLHANLGQRQS
jgi:3-oxoacyl-[acyl-carrier protein] reductase